MTDTWFWVSLSYATYGVRVDSRGVVVEAAPIAKWMVGKKWTTCQNWLRKRNATIINMKGR